MGAEPLQQKTTHKGRKNSQLDDFKRQEGGGERFWNISEQNQGTTGHQVQSPKVVRDIVFTFLVVHNMLRKHQGGANRAPTIGNDVAALQNEEVVHMPENNYGNPSREGKHQRPTKGLLQSHGALAWQRKRSKMCQPTTLGAEEAGTYQSFSGLPNYSKNFYFSWCCSNVKWAEAGLVGWWSLMFLLFSGGWSWGSLLLRVGW